MLRWLWWVLGIHQSRMSAGWWSDQQRHELRETPQWPRWRSPKEIEDLHAQQRSRERIVRIEQGRSKAKRQA